MLVQNIKIAADSLVFHKEGNDWQLLLVKRKNYPDIGKWAFPGGFVEDDEELEAAARRELQEETGLVVTKMKQFHTFGKVGRDPRGRTVSVVYYTVVDTADKVEGADDAAEAAWIRIKDIQELAFDHMEVLQQALRELSGELK